MRFAVRPIGRGQQPPMPKRFENHPRIAIVTGSDSGIGEASAVVLAEAGFDVGITRNTDEEGAQETADKARNAGARAEVTHLDLAQRLGGIGVLINNAGTGSSTPALDIGYDEWRKVIAV